MANIHDIAVIGGGILGCTTALHLAHGGMRVAVVEARGDLCTQASGVNTGHIGVMSGRAYRVPYALESIALWRDAARWLGADIGYHRRSGLKVAFTEAEAAQLTEAVAAMREAGGVLELVGANRARELEPSLSRSVVLAAVSPEDGFANPLRMGSAFRSALDRAGIETFVSAPVTFLEAGRFFNVHTSAGIVLARRLLLAGGVWMGELAAMLGVELPTICRVSMVTVTERQAPLMRCSVSTASGMLSLKQVENGTVLIGGGWQGIGSPKGGPREVIPEAVIGNLRLACKAIPALAQARAVRTWLGLEARVADNMPLAGPMPGVPGAWVVGAVHTGFALGPAFGSLMARIIRGEVDPVPDFDPHRFVLPKVDKAQPI